MWGIGAVKYCIDFGFGDVAAEDVAEIFEKIAFGLSFADPDGPWLHAIGFELAGKPEFVDLFAVAEFGPGSVGQAGESLQDGSGEEAFGAVEGEGHEDVQEEAADTVDSPLYPDYHPAKAGC